MNKKEITLSLWAVQKAPTVFQQKKYLFFDIKSKSQPSRRHPRSPAGTGPWSDVYFFRPLRHLASNWWLSSPATYRVSLWLPICQRHMQHRLEAKSTEPDITRKRWNSFNMFQWCVAIWFLFVLLQWFYQLTNVHCPDLIKQSELQGWFRKDPANLRKGHAQPSRFLAKHLPRIMFSVLGEFGQTVTSLSYIDS